MVTVYSPEHPPFSIVYFLIFNNPKLHALVFYQQHKKSKNRLTLMVKRFLLGEPNKIKSELFTVTANIKSSDNIVMVSHRRFEPRTT